VYGEEDKCKQNFSQKSERMRLLGIFSRRWKDEAKSDHGGIEV
jgi:hypothetical protein